MVRPAVTASDGSVSEMGMWRGECGNGVERGTGSVMVKNSSAPDPWGNNQHSVRAQGTADENRNWRSSAPSGPGNVPSWSAAKTPATWGPPGASVAPRVLVRPPYLFLWIAFAAALLALVLTAGPGGLAVGVAAWVLAGFVGFGSAVMFVQRDARRQAEVFYARDPRAPWLYRLAIALSFIGVVVAAVRIALIVGRMG